jgi:hypothetical protein
MLQTPTSVVAAVAEVGTTTVDYAVNWAISYIPTLHTGPYEVTVGYSKNGGSYTTLATINSTDHPATSTTHEDADMNATYRYRVTWYCGHCDDDSAFGYSNTIAYYSDTTTDAMTMTDEVTYSESTMGAIVSDAMTMTEAIEITLSDIVADSMTMTDVVRDGTTLKTAYAYYLADEDGKVYTYSGEYYSYNGSAIPSYLKIKKTDYSELDPRMSGRFNTTYRAKLTYVDKGQHLVTFYYSTDGGVTYHGVAKTIGTTAAPGSAAVAYFDFIASGEFFNFKLESSTTTGTFQWIGLELFFSMGGEAFSLG